jgi:hypothetical protein
MEDLQRQILPLKSYFITRISRPDSSRERRFQTTREAVTTRFIQQHPPLTTGHRRTMDIQRLIALNTDSIQVYFNSS